MLKPDYDRVFELIKNKDYQPFLDRGNREYVALERLCWDLVPQKSIDSVGPDGRVETKTYPDYQAINGYEDLIALLKKAGRV